MYIGAINPCKANKKDMDSSSVNEDEAAAAVSAKQLWSNDVVEPILVLGYTDMYNSIVLGFGLRKHFGNRIRALCYIDVNFGTQKNTPTGSLWTASFHADAEYLFLPLRVAKLYGIAGIALNQQNVIETDLVKGQYWLDEDKYITHVKSKTSPGIDVGLGIEFTETLRVEIRGLVTSFTNVSFNMVL